MLKADVVASVNAAETLPLINHAADSNSLRAYLHSRCSDLDPTGYGFHLTRGMLLSIPMYRPVASQLLIDGSFASVRVTLIQTPASVLRHTWPVIRTVDTASWVTIPNLPGIYRN